MTRPYYRTFYRVEDRKREGFYASYNTKEDILSELRASDRHPLPEYDSKLTSRIEDQFCSHIHHFAFCSKQQLRSWLYKKKWRNALDSNGFFVTKLRAKGWAGDTQGIFEWETRSFLKQYSLLEI